MRLLAVLLLILAAPALSACGNSCQDLGNRLCQCSGGGSARQSCERAVQQELKAQGLSGSDKSFCSEKLATCNNPDGTEFCEWINTADAKVACGLAIPTP